MHYIFKTLRPEQTTPSNAFFLIKILLMFALDGQA